MGLEKHNRLLFEKEDTYSLRGICMMAIIVHHLFQFTSTLYGVHYLFPIAFILQAAGYLASAVFFLLSGYGMTLSLWKHKPNIADALKRISKIYLPYFFFWLVCIVLIAFDHTRRYSLIDLGSLVTFQLPYMGGGKWFIVSIIVLYCCLMIMSRIVTTITKVAELMLVLTSIYVILQITLIHMPTQWYNSIMAFPIGVLCAAKKDCIQQYNNSRVGAILIAVFIMSYMAYFVMKGIALNVCERVTPLFQIMASLAFALYTIRLVCMINIRSVVLDSIGNYSLCVLIAHQVLVVYASHISSVYSYVLIVIVGTFILTWIYSKIHIVIFQSK